MGEKVKLTVEERSVTGKKVARLRKEGLVPAVMYGNDVAAKSVMAPSMLVQKVWHAAGKRQPIELTLGHTKRLAMIKSADIDPVKHKVRHLSLHVVKQNEKVDAEVPIKIKLSEGNDETPAERAGLVVLTTVESVPVRALPNNLPEALEFDGEKLTEEGQHATIADLIVPEGVEVDAEPDQVIASVTSTAALAAANEALAGEAESEADVPAENGAVEATPETEETSDKSDKK
ncbi:MAG TPA: 50S ribosomal protein L25 [Candidatus Saccharimonadales bacterium]|nr:50S ribosomal protein L25 [Candidatus Saccharimonadales bacterium]